MQRYRIIESAEHRIERVHGYADLEIHHPSHHGHQRGRHYATVDGRREEVLKTPTSAGHLMVSKDFILTDESGSTHVPVPSPTAGYVGRVDARNGLVCIYDHKGGELIAQVRHMDLRGSNIREGQTVAYGQPLGFQGGYGGGKAHAYGVHTHIDFNTSRLDEFKKYFNDIDRGVISMGVAPPMQAHVPARVAGEAGSHGGVSRGEVPLHGDDWVRQAQSALAHLGYTGVDGRPVVADGLAGAHTRHALRQFQTDHGLTPTGHIDARTRDRLVAQERTMASSTHPAHALYRQALGAVQELDRQLGIPDGPHTIALAGVTAAEAARAGLTRVDRVEISANRARVQAVQFTGSVDHWVTNRTSGAIDVAHAVKQPLEASSRDAEHALASRQSAEQHVARERAPLRAPVL